MVMRREHAIELCLDDIADVIRQILLLSFLVLVLGRIFTAFAFVQDRGVVVSGDRRFDIYPTSVKSTRCAT